MYLAYSFIIFFLCGNILILVRFHAFGMILTKDDVHT